MAQQPRPFITCHVLDTVAGRPAADMRTKLTLLTPLPPSSAARTSTSFLATTNSDGRVTAWTPNPADESSSTTTTTLDATISEAKKTLPQSSESEAPQQLVWSITFQSGEYYGAGKTFWPEVELRFFTRLDELHYHVPLLLGPWSYTTYRGS